MGLAVVHGIVKSHAGAVYVHSQVDKGTTFDIFLPVLEKPPVTKCASQEPIPRGTETILLVDDETMIVDIAKTMLESIGYRVESRTSATEALALFLRKPDQFGAVITDLTMPKMTGLNLAENLLKARSDIPIILCTGFSTDIDEHTIRRHGISALVLKPILMRDMAGKLRKAIDEKAKKSHPL
jgi:CheY-like chemotaxis protein